MRRLKKDIDHIYQHIQELFAEIEKLKNNQKPALTSAITIRSKKQRTGILKSQSQKLWTPLDLEMMIEMKLKGYKVASIANILGRSKGSIEQQLCKAKKQGKI